MNRMILLSALVLAGCQTAAQTGPRMDDSQAFAAAQKMLDASLKDPQSARIGPMNRRTYGKQFGMSYDVVCGTVNSKNSFGAYTGNQKFAYVVDDGRLVFDDEPGASGAATLWCSF